MDDVFVEFSYRVDELQDYPNRDLIARLTQLALENVVIAEKLGNVVMSKLIHPQTLTTYKKPLYYVVDSILKKVGGPYPAYFQNALAEHFPKTVQEINEEDRHKLDFLFGTWEERQILSLDLLAKMRQLLKQQPVQFISLLPSFLILTSLIIVVIFKTSATTVPVSTRAKYANGCCRRRRRRRSSAYDDE